MRKRLLLAYISRLLIVRDDLLMVCTREYRTRRLAGGTGAADETVLDIERRANMAVRVGKVVVKE